MSDAPPEPFVPAWADLKDFAYTPLYRARLFGSEFHAKASDAEWRAGLTLWLKSQDQVPAGSLPDDDVALCRLAEFGRDMRAWRKVKPMALHGWQLCADGRLYHPVVAEIVIEQIDRKKGYAERMAAARAAKAERRLSQTQSQSGNTSITDTITEPITDTITEPITDTIIGSVTDHKGIEGKGIEEKGKKDSVGFANAQPTAAGGGNGAVDLAAEAFAVGVRILTRRGVPERQARSLIGKHRGEIGDDGRLLAILASVERNNPVEPIAYLKAAIKEAVKPSTTPFASPGFA